MLSMYNKHSYFLFLLIWVYQKRKDRTHISCHLTFVVTCHPIGSSQIRDLSPNEVGEDPDGFVRVVVVSEQLLVPKTQFIIEQKMPLQFSHLYWLNMVLRWMCRELLTQGRWENWLSTLSTSCIRVEIILFRCKSSFVLGRLSEVKRPWNLNLGGYYSLRKSRKHVAF